MDVLLFLGYVVLCLIVGVIGRYTRIGYWGTVLVGLVATPFLTFLFLYFFAPTGHMGGLAPGPPSPPAARRGPAKPGRSSEASEGS